MNLNERAQNLLGEFSRESLYGVAISQWILFVVAAVFLYVLLSVLRTIFTKDFAQKAKSTEYTIYDFLLQVLNTTSRATVFAVAMYIGTFLITMTGEARGILTRIIVVVMLIQVGFWGNATVQQWLHKGLRRFVRSEVAAETSAAVIKVFAILIIWAIVIALALSNIGVNIGAVIAGLGLGGIAVAFALQKILGDVFNSVAILMDKPFEVGDFIIVGDFLGSVERIGIKTTRIRSLGGEQLIFANTDLIESRIRNYKRMKERRVVFGYGLIYQTRADQLELAKQITTDVIKAMEGARFDRAHFKAYGDSSLNFEVVYYVLSPDFNVYMDIQERINLELCRRFEKEGLSFAYPTRTLYLKGESPIRIQDERLSDGNATGGAPREE